MREIKKCIGCLRREVRREGKFVRHSLVRWKRPDGIRRGYCVLLTVHHSISVDGFGGLVVSMLASGSRVRGFKPEKSSACLPSEGK
jgi:hypothetical protein